MLAALRAEDESLVQWFAVLEWARRQQWAGQDVRFSYAGEQYLFRYRDVVNACVELVDYRPRTLEERIEQQL